MRPTALVPLLALPLVLTGCGASGPSGAEALKVVRGDWQFNHAFPGRPALSEYGEVLSSSRCQPKPDARGRLRCRLRVHSASLGRTRSVQVIVIFNPHGAVARWVIV
jgi:hypothetical protein